MVQGVVCALTGRAAFLFRGNVWDKTRCLAVTLLLHQERTRWLNDEVT